MENQSRGILEKTVDLTANALYLTGNGLVKYSPELVLFSTLGYLVLSVMHLGQYESHPYRKG